MAREQRGRPAVKLVESASAWAIPVLLMAILLHAWVRRVNVYDAFVEGAGEGFWLAVKVMPYLVGMFMALGVFRESGALEVLTRLFRPVLEPLGLKGELMPLMLIRPLSGSAAFGVTAELIRQYGPDSAIGRLAAVMQGSTDTTFYILTFYFGSVGIRRIRHSLLAGLAGDLAGFVASALVCRWFFGG
ncbi:MAG: spore maturation protein [Acetobacteraceae bacterium]|nr:spore maturation protein [Acetobacteraceae bacterium]